MTMYDKHQTVAIIFGICAMTVWGLTMYIPEIPYIFPLLLNVGQVGFMLTAPSKPPKEK
jgi:hypothetical protein